jgi:hypothetical protein
MAARKPAATPTNAAALADKADTDPVLEAYKDALKQRLGAFFTEYILDPQKAEKDFVAGLAILRGARDRALQLV